MKHLVQIKDLNEFAKELELAGSYGQSIGSPKPSCKTLAVEITISKRGALKTNLVVLENHKPLLKTRSLSKAVNRYNDLE